MKKYLVFLLCILLFGCEKVEEKSEITTTTTTTTTTAVQYVDDNPIKLGLYKYVNSNTNRELYTDYSTVYGADTDIGSYEVFFTNEDSISGNTFQKLWMEYYNKYKNIDQYKIGYNVAFKTTDGKSFDQTILKPDDGNLFYEYLQIYLYDDVHQTPGQWYSHVESDQVKADTIFSSIKLTNSWNASLIGDEITLTVFTYDSDDFDSNNKYRGNSFYTIKIKRK